MNEPFYKIIEKAIKDKDAWIRLPSGAILSLWDGQIVQQKNAAVSASFPKRDTVSG